MPHDFDDTFNRLSPAAGRATLLEEEDRRAETEAALHSTAEAARIAPTRTRPAEIDVDEVVRELQPAEVRRREQQFGIDHPVLRVASRSAVRTVPCPVCDGDSAVPLFALTRSRFRLVRCAGCGVGSLHPRPDPAEIAAFYPPSYYGSAGAKFVPAVERAVRLLGRRKTRFLLRGLPRGGRVLDIGCGRGFLLQAMADAGFEPHGFEISKTAAEGLDPRVRLRIGADLIDAEFPATHFDLVVLWHVFEHLPHPRETLAEVRRILKPGGRVAIAVPNFSSLQAKLFGPAWFHLDLPRHLYHFPVAALRRLIGESGFEPEYERHFSLRQNPFGWVQSALNALSPGRRNALYTMLKRNENGVASAPGPWRRALDKTAYWLGMPLAGLLSAACAMLRSGGTICLTGRRKRERSQAGDRNPEVAMTPSPVSAR